MSRDGSGNYSLAVGQPVTTGTTIDSTVFNLAMADIRDALTQSLAKDGQTTPTANLPMGGNKHTGVADASLANQYASAKQVQNGSLDLAGSVSNVVDAYAASVTPAIAAYVDGMVICFTPSVTNTTTAPTLALNGLAVKPINKEANIACAIGDLVINVIARLMYTSQGAGTWILLNPQKITGSRVLALPDASLSANVPLKNAANTFTALQTITPATNVVGLVINGKQNAYALSLLGNTTAGQGFGAYIQAGTNASDFAVTVRNAANSQDLFTVAGDGTWTVRGNGTSPASFTAAGTIGAVGPSANMKVDISSGTNSPSIDFYLGGVFQGHIGVSGNASGMIAGSALGDLNIRAQNNIINFSSDGGAHVNARIANGALQIQDGNNALFEAGFRGVPINQPGAPYTLALKDQGKCIYFNSGAPGTFTIPANASIAFPVGTAIVIDNDSASALTIAITSDTLVQVGTALTGSRTIGAGGQATIVKVTSTRWRISGVNVA